jgi:hypothetical protein
MPLGAFRLIGLSRLLAAAGRTAKTITPSSVTVSTTQSKFGGASAFFNSASSSIDVSPSTEFAFGTTNFTVEAWIYVTDVSVTRTIWSSTNTTNTMNFFVGTNRSINFVTTQTGTISSTSNAIALDTWTHVALCRTGTTTRAFVNGTVLFANSTAYNSTGALSATVGYDGTNSFAGYIDEVRVSDVSRYPAAFTAPTTAFDNDDSTLVLLHCDGANGSTTFTDDATPLTALSGVFNAGQVTGTASTITIPSNSKIGDLALLFDMSTTVTDTIPSGWTSISGVTTSGIRTNISRKTLESGDIGATITGMAGTTRKILFVFRPNGPGSTLTVSTPTSEATTATPSNQTVTAGDSPGTTPVISFWCGGSTGSPTVTLAGTTLVNSISGSGVAVRYRQWNQGQTPENQTASMSDSGTNTFQSFFIRFV